MSEEAVKKFVDNFMPAYAAYRTTPRLKPLASSLPEAMGLTSGMAGQHTNSIGCSFREQGSGKGSYF